MCITRSQDGDKPKKRRLKSAASRARSPSPTDSPTSVSKDTGNRVVRLAGAPARTHAKGTKPHAQFKRWRIKQFGGDIDPVSAAVDDAVRAFSRRDPERDRAVWLRVANQIGVDAFRDKMRQMQAQIDEARHNCAPIANLAGYFQMMLNRYTDHKRRM